MEKVPLPPAACRQAGGQRQELIVTRGWASTSSARWCAGHASRRSRRLSGAGVGGVGGRPGSPLRLGSCNGSNPARDREILLIRRSDNGNWPSPTAPSTSANPSRKPIFGRPWKSGGSPASSPDWSASTPTPGTESSTPATARCARSSPSSLPPARSPGCQRPTCLVTRWTAPRASASTTT
jgi:hypothetical protein